MGWDRWLVGRIRRGAGAAGASAALAVLVGGVTGLLQDRPGVAVAVTVVAALVVGGVTALAGNTSAVSPPVPWRSDAQLAVAGPWNVPGPVAGFTGREGELAALAKALRGRRVRIAALHGLGGMGKTQVALRYAADLADAEEVTVGWLMTASSRALVVDGLARLAPGLGLPQVADTRDAATAVLAELGRRSGWLLIYDDVTAARDVAGLLPVAGDGRVVITSRYSAWRDRIRALPVHRLDQEAAVAFLLDRTGDADREAAVVLAERLGGLPLALEQAAAYCLGGITLAGYLRRYDREPMRLLGLGQPLGREPVARTWAVSIRRVRRQHRAAVDLLRLLAFVAPAPLPSPVLGAAPELLPARLRRLVPDTVGFDGAVRVLADLSLLTSTASGVTVHALVQTVVRGQLPARSRWRRDRAAWADTAALMLIAGFPTGGHTADRWDRCAELRPHLEAVLLHDLPPVTAATLQYVLAQYLEDRGDYPTARNLMEQSVSARKRALGEQHPLTLASMNGLAAVLSDLGELPEARTLHEQTMLSRQRVLGGEHPETLESMNSLARVQRAMGDLAAAKSLLDQTLLVRQRVLGEEHPDTLASMNNLAITLRGLGDLAASRSLHQQTLQARQRVLGEEHPETLASMNNLAVMLRLLGDLAQSRTLLERTLTLRKRVLGEEHPETVASMNNLAETLRDLGDLPSARALHELALTMFRREVGEDHLYTLNSMNNLARTLHEMGDLAWARTLHEQALAQRRRVLGAEHPSTLTSMNDLALVLADAGDTDEARTLHEQTLALRRRVLGEEHPDTLASIANLEALDGQSDDPDGG
ncbi:FxSxx-COOH system tetratricopeptide repeat protein [Rhizocola hellebori]|nr:FxSxx-COOH system tetratricopeptide repeat protein [Rhizocola hellebori]